MQMLFELVVNYGYITRQLDHYLILGTLTKIHISQKVLKQTSYCIKLYSSLLIWILPDKINSK